MSHSISTTHTPAQPGNDGGLNFSRKPKMHRDGTNSVNAVGVPVLNNLAYGAVQQDQHVMNDLQSRVKQLEGTNKDLEEINKLSEEKIVVQLQQIDLLLRQKTEFEQANGNLLAELATKKAELEEALKKQVEPKTIEELVVALSKQVKPKTAKELTEAGVHPFTTTEIQEELASVKELVAECEEFRTKVEKLSGDMCLTESSTRATHVSKETMDGYESKLKEYAETRAKIEPQINDAIKKLNTTEEEVEKRTIDNTVLQDASVDQVTAIRDRTLKPLKGIRTFSMVFSIPTKEIQSGIKTYLEQYKKIFPARGELQGQLARLTESFATIEKTMPLIRARIPVAK